MRISIKNIIYGLLLVSLISGCEKNLPQYIEIYHNGFDNENGDILVFKGDNVDNSEKIFTYNNTQILGPLNHNAVFKEFHNLPAHKFLKITFDIYIHDAWKGNDNLASDFWGLFIDGKRVYYTTFSNLPNTKQAYPEQEGYYFPPGSNAFNKNLPGLCSMANNPAGTSVYQFVWLKPHTNSDLKIALSDLVRETDLCVKSWSLDNLVITCIEYENN